jgi:hypothetical protein
MCLDHWPFIQFAPSDFYFCITEEVLQRKGSWLTRWTCDESLGQRSQLVWHIKKQGICLLLLVVVDIHVDRWYLMKCMFKCNRKLRLVGQGFLFDRSYRNYMHFMMREV